MAARKNGVKRVTKQSAVRVGSAKKDPAKQRVGVKKTTKRRSY